MNLRKFSVGCEMKVHQTFMDVIKYPTHWDRSATRLLFEIKEFMKYENKER